MSQNTPSQQSAPSSSAQDTVSDPFAADLVRFPLAGQQRQPWESPWDINPAPGSRSPRL